MDAGSYTKEIIDIVYKNSNFFYIRANKSNVVFEQIQEITKWEDVEINDINYQVASIGFKQFTQDKNYRLVIMREQTSNNQIDVLMFLQKKLLNIEQYYPMTRKAQKKTLLFFIVKEEQQKKYLM